MALPLIPLLALGFLISLTLYKFIIEPAFLSPLAKIPAAHWSAPVSSLWILNERRRQRETPTVHAAHQRLGPIIRLAPNEISVNSVEGGIRAIYSGGYEKGDWYKNIFINYGLEPMFAMPDHGRHSKRKRMLSNIYAKSTLQSSQTMSAITRILLYERLIPRLRELGRNEQPLEFYAIFSAITHDFVSAYVFGLGQSTNFVQEPTMGRKFFRDYKARQRYQFWPQDLPNFTKFMKRVGCLWMIVPPWVRTSNNAIQGMILSMQDRAEVVVKRAEMEREMDKVEDWPSVYAQLRSALLQERSSKVDLEVGVEQLVQKHRLEIASEMLDHTLAGFDTSTITLTFFAWELSLPHNKIWQDKLHKELSDADLTSHLDAAKEIDNLPILQAILMETLRLHAAIPGNQPRITPPNAALGAPGHEVQALPAGVRVQAQAWSLHREGSVFPDPENFNPARWLPSDHPDSTSSEEQSREMGRWFWAFGSGGRMCVGSNLAILDMKAIIAAIWGNFETGVVHDEGMVHNGTYVAGPVGKDGKHLVLTLGEIGVVGVDA